GRRRGAGGRGGGGGGGRGRGGGRGARRGDRPAQGRQRQQQGQAAGDPYGVQGQPGPAGGHQVPEPPRLQVTGAHGRPHQHGRDRAQRGQDVGGVGQVAQPASRPVLRLA